MESIPKKDEKIDEGSDILSSIVTSNFLEQIFKNKYCTSEILKNLIETKYQYVAEDLRKMSNLFTCRKSFKLMIEKAFEGENK